MKKSGIGELRTYFATLKTSEKREFILKLKEKTESSKSTKYAKFLSECTENYNEEVREHKKGPVKSEGAMFMEAVNSAWDEVIPDATTEVFAKAISSMFIKPKGSSPPRLVGKWEREENEEVFYFSFHEDGSFETNEIKEHFHFRGFYKVGETGDVMIEPLEALQISSLSVTSSGSELCIIYRDGTMREYKKTHERGV